MRRLQSLLTVGLLMLLALPARAQLDSLSQQLLVIDQELRAAAAFRVLEVARLLVGTEGAEELPTRFVLYGAYPNPFRERATIRFAVPRRERVRLEVYDVLGRRVGVLLDEEVAPGLYEVHFEAQGLASGLYFYRLRAGRFVQQRKMIIIK